MHPCEDLLAVRAWIAKQRSGESGRQGASLDGTPHFVVQRGVAPRLLDGRRFVLRAHVLLVRTESGASWGRGYVHDDVITLLYSQLHQPQWREDKSLHVSQAGKTHPIPFQLSALPGPEAELVPPQLREITRQILLALSNRPEAAPQPAVGSTLYSLMGLDLAVEPGAACRTVVLEVNTYPAIGNGTMSTVPREIYTRVVRDMLCVLGPPAGAPCSAAECGGGSVRLPRGLRNGTY